MRWLKRGALAIFVTVLIVGVAQMVVVSPLGTGVLAVVWYFRYCRRYPHTGPILATLPLFFAWRSMWPYFYYTGIIVLAAVLIDEYGAADPVNHAALKRTEDSDL
jgi:hypothetical protein